MTDDLPNRLLLKKRMYVRTSRQTRILWIAIVLLMVTIAVLFTLLSIKMTASGLGWPDAMASISKKFSEQPLQVSLNALLLLALLLNAVFMLLAQKREQLTLSPAGIEYRSPLPGWLQFLWPSWALQWSDIHTATLSRSSFANNPQAVRLTLVSPTQTRRLVPFMWVNPDDYKTVSPLKEWREAVRQGSAYINNSLIIRYIDENVRALAIDRQEIGGNQPFALDKHPRTRAIVVAFFVMGLYALFDGLFIGKEVYVEAPFYAFYVISGIVGAGIAMLWQQRGNVPRVESAVLAILLGISIGLAEIPGLLRLNALTDTSGIQSYDYELVSHGTFRSTRPGLPDIHFIKYPDYWAQFQVGQQQVFNLRKGGLDFWQLDMAPVYSAMRDYYRHQDDRK